VPDFLKIRVTPEFMDAIFVRDEKCNRLRLELGEPDSEGFYTPVVHVDTTDNPLTSLLLQHSSWSGRRGNYA
jgi:hypothetical protein